MMSFKVRPRWLMHTLNEFITVTCKCLIKVINTTNRGSNNWRLKNKYFKWYMSFCLLCIQCGMAVGKKWCIGPYHYIQSALRVVFFETVHFLLECWWGTTYFFTNSSGSCIVLCLHYYILLIIYIYIYIYIYYI